MPLPRLGPPRPGICDRLSPAQPKCGKYTGEDLAVLPPVPGSGIG
jgi:hypothetical protein